MHAVYRVLYSLFIVSDHNLGNELAVALIHGDLSQIMRLWYQPMVTVETLKSEMEKKSKNV